MAGLKNRTLILGGRKSGKSLFAETLIMASDFKAGVYIATAKVEDSEMAKKVEAHKERRHSHNWIDYEEDIDLVYALKKAQRREKPILIECLSLWVSNLMSAGKEVNKEFDRLENYLARIKSPLIFVSLEVGLGLIPIGKLVRDYSDNLGVLNTRISALCDEVYLIVAGNSIKIK